MVPERFAKMDCANAAGEPPSSEIERATSMLATHVALGIDLRIYCLLNLPTALLGEVIPLFKWEFSNDAAHERSKLAKTWAQFPLVCALAFSVSRGRPDHSVNVSIDCAGLRLSPYLLMQHHSCELKRPNTAYKRRHL